MRFRITILVVIAMIFIATVTQAQLIQITFDPPHLPRGGAIVGTWTEQGFIFRGYGWGVYSYDTGVGLFSDDGTAHLSNVSMFEPVNSNVKFNIYSIDLAEYSTAFAFPQIVKFIGYKNDGSIVTNSFTLDGVTDGPGPLVDFQKFYFNGDFQNLNYIEVPYQSGTGPATIDNVVLSIVPEPCTLALLALGGVGLLRKRRA